MYTYAFQVIFVFITCAIHTTQFILLIRRHEVFSRKIILNYGQIQEICHILFQGQCALDVLFFCIRILYVDVTWICRTCLKPRTFSSTL
jgi:hypothetical protein